jgi:hypothetical protein
MFIDGDLTKQQQQNSIPLRITDTNKPHLSSKTNQLFDTNSTKTSTRKKSRKSMKILQQPTSSINNNENKILNYTSPIEQSIDFIDEDDEATATHFIVDITNQSLRHRNVSSDNNDEINLPNNTDESHLKMVNIDIKNDKNKTVSIR